MVSLHCIPVGYDCFYFLVGLQEVLYTIKELGVCAPKI